MQEPPNAFDVERPLSSAQLLRTRFGAFFAANLLGSTALWFLDVAAAILIYQETRSALWVSLVAVFGFGASIASSPFGGIIADRFDRRRALAVAFGAASLAALIVAVIPGGSGDVRLLLAVTAVGGVARGIYTPIGQSLAADLVERRDLAASSSLTSMGFSVGRALGPALGAVLVTTLGGPTTYAVVVALLLGFIVLIRSTPGVTRSTPPTPRAERIPTLVYLRREPRIALLLATAAIIGMTTDPVLTLGPALADRWDAPQWVAGLAVSAFGTGAVLAGLAGARMRRLVGEYRLATVSLALIALCFVIVGVTPSPAVALVALLIAGAAFLTANADIMTLLQEQIDPALRGRVWAVWSIGFLGSRPVAAVIEGLVADFVGLTAAMVVMAGVALAGGALVMLIRRMQTGQGGGLGDRA